MENKIIHGDCLEVMKEIKDKSADMILCDLPYGTTACAWDEIISLNQLWKQYKRIIRPNGFIVLFGSQPFTTKLINSNIKQFSHQWIWEKEQSGNPLLANMMPMKNFEDVIVFYNEYGADTYLEHPLREYSKKFMEKIGKNNKEIEKDLGHRKAEHFFYITSTQYDLCTEEIYEELLRFYNLKGLDFLIPYSKLKKIDEDFYSKYPRVYNPQKINGKKYKSGAGYFHTLQNDFKGGNISSERYPTSIIKFNTDKSKSQHPTQKPVALFEYLIKTYTNKGNLVLDNCIGSGTTAIACIRTNRKFIGIEKEEKYVEIANKRINDALVENHEGGENGSKHN